MRKSFQNLSITRLLDDRCYLVDGPVLRIYFELSAAPPLGWSYLFTLTWQTVTYPAKAPAGIETGAIWIECPAEQVKSHHLPELQAAVERTNNVFREFLQQKAGAAQRQRALNNETRAQLAALAASLKPAPISPAPPKSARAALDSLLRLVSRKSRLSPGKE